MTPDLTRTRWIVRLIVRGIGLGVTSLAFAALVSWWVRDTFARDVSLVLTWAVTALFLSRTRR